MSLNKVLLIGNVGKDPEIRHLESGASVASFTLATSERYRDRGGELRENTEWHNIVAWRQLARYTTEIMANSIQLLGRRGDNPAADGAPAPAAAAPAQRPAPSYSAPRPEPAHPQSAPMIQPEDISADSGADDLPF